MTREKAAERLEVHRQVRLCEENRRFDVAIQRLQTTSLQPIFDRSPPVFARSLSPVSSVDRDAALWLHPRRSLRPTSPPPPLA